MINIECATIVHQIDSTTHRFKLLYARKDKDQYIDVYIFETLVNKIRALESRINELEHK